MSRLPLWAGVAPGLVILGAGVGLLVFYLWRVRPRHPVTSRRYAGSPLVPPALVDFFYWVIEPLVALLARHRITPNHVTGFSLVLATAAAAWFASGHFIWGAWTLAAGAGLDAVDGFLARHTGTSSQAGAFLDSFIDRLSEGIVYLGLAFYGLGGWLTWTAVGAIIGSYAVSYARARGESLGVECKEGLMQRPERLLLLFFVTLGAPYLALYLEPGRTAPVFHLAVVGTGFIALASLWTAFSRARFIFDALKRRELTVARSSEEPARAELGDERLPAH